jgi:hypothetical protein
MLQLLRLCYHQQADHFHHFNWSTTEVTPTISVSSAGTYDVTVVETSTGCELVSQPVTIVYFPVIPATLSDTGFCPGESVVLSANAGFTNVVWSTSETTNSISVSTAGTFYYTADDNNGCAVNSDTITTVIGTAPAVNATASPDTICAGGSSTLSSGAAQGLTYNWTPGNQNTSDINCKQCRSVCGSRKRPVLHHQRYRRGFPI